MTPIASRPNIADLTSSAQFHQWYYLKSELIAFARANAIPCAGGKLEISARIAAYIDGKPLPSLAKRKSASTFKWASAILSPQTVITDNVSFGPNVRTFLASQIGPQFVCSSDFMDWVRVNNGRTLGDAVEAWQALELRKADPAFETHIRSHNQYNQFTRDILQANRGLSLKSVRQIWKAKRARPGSMTYSAKDLDLLVDN
jgi:hypothetical protein